MSAANRRPWHRVCAACLAALALGASAGAHGPDMPGKIEFLPPPLDGTISLGIYDGAGKLVRVLHREAEITELTAGADGLITRWDGKDDQGRPCPAGVYRARGVTVGDLGVEGVDFIGNDWVTENDSPRIRRITGLGVSTDGHPVIAATLAGQDAPFFYLVTRPPGKPGDDDDLKLTPQPEMPRPALTVRDGKIEGASIPGLKEPVADAAPGEDGFIWAIVGNTLKKFSKKGVVVRTLDPEPGDPPPVKVAAAPNRKAFFVLYEDARLQRLRGYDILPGSGGREADMSGGAPREKRLELVKLFEYDIWASERYEQIAPRLNFPGGKPFTASEEIAVTLLPNPLLKNKAETLRLRAGVDKEGSYLVTADGLPLCRIGESKALLWARIGQAPGGRAVLLFNSDGAVVEEFQIADPSRMMTFDAGSVPWAGAEPSPTAAPSPSASPDVTPQPPIPASTPAAAATP